MTDASLAAKLTEVLDDAESQHPGGWGPDVTTVVVIREVRDALSAAAATDAAGAADDVDVAWWALCSDPDFVQKEGNPWAAVQRHRPLIEAAIRSSRATSETPRETPLAGPLDVDVLLDARLAVEAGYILQPDRTKRAYWEKVAAEYDHLAARGAE